MALKREVSLAVGLATVALVYGIYQVSLPSIADVRANEPDDRTLDQTERTAAWTAAAAVAGISLLAKDPTVFVLGGTTVVALSWLHKHGNMFDPFRGRASHGATSDHSLPETDNSMTGYTPA